MKDGYYLLAGRDGGQLGVWSVTKKSGAVKLDAYDFANGRDPAAFLAELASDPITLHQAPWTLVPMELPVNSTYRRIWRPSINEVNAELTSDDEDAARGSLAQLVFLIGQLENILQVIEPEGGNLEAWGHAIRNVLIGACTEVEAQLRGVLIANGYVAPKRREQRDWNTSDFVKVAGHMRLSEYAVRLAHSPRTEALRPFANWSSDSARLPWYSAYNDAKHDRERHFRLASLKCALEATAACVVILYAQYGLSAFVRSEPFVFFRLAEQPSWPMNQQYFNARQGPYGQIAPLPLS